MLLIVEVKVTSSDYQEMSEIKNNYNINLYGNGEASKKIITELLK